MVQCEIEVRKLDMGQLFSFVFCRRYTRDFECEVVFEEFVDKKRLAYATTAIYGNEHSIVLIIVAFKFSYLFFPSDEWHNLLNVSPKLSKNLRFGKTLSKCFAKT